MKAYRLYSEQEARELLERVKDTWEPGQAAKVAVTKRNEEIKESPVLNEIAQRILESPIPKAHFIDEITPPKFNRYRNDGEYGPHTDSAVMYGLRTDLACTLFLTDGYEGGDLVIGGQRVKLGPGECIVYDCWRPHYVEPVTSGERIAVIWWMQSFIRNEDQRDLLNMLHSVIAEELDEKKFAKLGAVHEKLVKMWWS